MTEPIVRRPCAATGAIQTIGDVRSEIDYVTSLLESALDQAEAICDGRGGMTADERRTCNLVRVARDMVTSVSAMLGGVEVSLGQRVRERIATMAAADCGSSCRFG